MLVSPPTERVDVWFTPTSAAADEPRLQAYRSILSDEEQTRCDRFVFAADRQRFLIARAMVRSMLSRYVPIGPGNWRFRIEQYGRPEVAELPPGSPDLRFNLSHTEGLVACAVTIGRDIGLDVEYVLRPLTYQVPERFFSAREVSDLRSLPETDQHLAFFDYWTLKEAYIKARGLGLALPLGQFSFIRRADVAPAIVFDPELHDDPASWQFAQFWPTSHHRMALAVRRSGPDLRLSVAQVIPAVDRAEGGSSVPPTTA